MAQQSRFDLADLALGGTLRTLLADQRANDVSYDEIAIRLRDSGIQVTGETVRRWCLALSDPERQAS